MTINTYNVGDLVRLTATFAVADTNTDPTTVTIKTKTPSGAVTAKTSTGGEVSKDSTGVYHLDVEATEAGTWFWRAEGTGTAEGASEAEFIVRRSQFS